MKCLRQIVLILTLVFGVAVPGHATVLLDDTFADGKRNIQNLPTESAWYVSSSSAWTTSVNAMSVAMSSTAILGVTYFGTNSSTPVRLQVGDTLTVTIWFNFNGVAPLNSSTDFKIGVYDFADSTLSPTWATADLSSNSGQGSGVQGYALFQNCGVNFNSASPMNLYKRTNVSDSALLSSSGDYTLLGSGPGSTNNFPGFTNATAYSLQLSLYRTNSTTLAITAIWQNQASKAAPTNSVMDTGAANFNFDGIGFRPAKAGTTSTNITINEVRVDLVSVATPPSINFDPQDDSALVGQDTSFSVQASGTAPLSYQWYYNTNTVLTNATGSTLTLTNVQLSDSGGYSVVVTNSYGSATSAVAQLTVNLPVAPSIITQPQDQTSILPGATATFSVIASGTDPLSYQWYYNTNTLLTNATDSILTITNIQPANAGSYSVCINNSAGSTNSSNAFLTVNTSPVAPVFNSQPASLVVLAGSSASFTAVAGGTAPISYQWSKNGTPISGATSSTLNLSNVQTTDDGSYTLTATNSVGSVTSNPAQLTVTTTVPLVNSAYNLTGFATVGAGCTGGGVIATNDPAYVQVYTPLDFANALQSAYKTAGSVKVIEIMNDLSLGWNEVGAAVQAVGPFRANTTPLLHPVLLTVGESLIDIKPKSGLTIFSANGATIKHCNFNIKSCHNIIVRNLKFDENFEWDESTKGQYDRNDWDFITVGNGGAVSNLWVDHCTFTKSYDGILDTKDSCSDITISWCKYVGDDGATNTNSWLWQQINYLEQSPSSHPMYNFLRTHGYSTANIVTIMQAHDKTHLAGQNDLDPNNATITMTFHHLWIGVWDRCVPRLRAGNVHDYNLYVDDTTVLAARRLRDSIAATMSTANQNTLNNAYSFEPPVNGTISTENGAILVEKSVYIDCLWPLRNNQTDPSNPEYTGKIEALDSIYQFDSTTIRGNSTDSGNPMGPFQAPIIAFSWNTNAATSNGQLPYSYTPDDPSQLSNIVTSATAGAGAGVLTWNKTNWLMTTYAATAPTIVANPQSQTNSPGQSVTFTVAAGGSAPMSYQWYFNTNSAIPNATNAFLTLNNAQATYAGTYSVVVTNTAGTAGSAYALLTVSASAPSQPQLSDFFYDSNSGTFSLTIHGDTGYDYIVLASTNLTDWAGIFTNHSSTPPFVWTDSGASNFSQRYYRIQVGP
ncbi:MAG: immunoglobulin domain-containing protein [Verrucomicrobiia bacterium]